MKHLLKIALAATFAATAFNFAAMAQEKVQHPSENYKIGVAGYTFRKLPFEDALAFLKSIDVKYMSIKDFQLPLDASVLDMEAFKAKCAEYGVEPYILGPIYMRSVEDVDRAFDYASRFGAKMFMGVPNYELLDYCIQKVKSTGIKLAIHTHGPDNAAFPDVRKIVEMVGDPTIGIGCCIDLGHSFRFGKNPAKDLVKYKDWIYDIHIKDETAPSKQGKTWEMGRGKMDIPAIVKAIKKSGYKGVISIEFEKNPANPLIGVAESVGYLRGVMDCVK
ncbi:MAG: sugar phosphate isomerase/epimerase family protein [Candidatus Cryptobacteroides sp.]|nr:sugar phosphate isomerase/epimerase family protein [Candidatus Cryptobacteroides sp.]